MSQLLCQSSLLKEARISACQRLTRGRATLEGNRGAWGFILGRPKLRSQSLSYVLGEEHSCFPSVLVFRGQKPPHFIGKETGTAWALSFLCLTPNWVKCIHLMDFHQVTFSWSSNGLGVGPRNEWNQAPALETLRSWAWSLFGKQMLMCVVERLVGFWTPRVEKWGSHNPFTRPKKITAVNQRKSHPITDQGACPRIQCS